MLSPLIERIERLSAHLDRVPNFGWGTITELDPIRIRLAGESDPLAVTPSTIYHPTAVGERVFYVHVFHRVIILGRAGGVVGPVDTGWQPHGGTPGTGIIFNRPLEWRIYNGAVWWRGQVLRTGDWSTGKSGDLVVYGLPPQVRPAQAAPLYTASDLSVPVSSILWPDGSIRVYAENSRTAWPHLGGVTPLG